MKVTLGFPPTANRYWRNILVNGHPRTVLSRQGRAFKERAYYEALSQGLRPVDGDVALDLVVHFPTRAGDLDNRLKPLLDALEGAAYGNDRQVVELHVYRREDKDHPRAEVTVRELAPDDEERS